MSKTELEPEIHIHSHSAKDIPVSKSHKKVLQICVIFVLAMMIIGIALTFPSPASVNKVSEKVRETIDFAESQYGAVVDSSEVRICEGQESLPEETQQECKYVLFDVTDRKVISSEGQPCLNNQPFVEDQSKALRYCVEQAFQPDSKNTPAFNDGDKVSLSFRSGEEIAPQSRYSFADQDRRGVLIAVIILFLIAVILFGAWRGLLAVAGLIVSLLVIALYILPALVTGQNGLVVALAGGTAVAAAALYLAHGFNNSTHIAFLSSIGSVLTIAFFAELFFTLGRFGGFVSEEAGYLAASGANVDLRGLLIAGVVLASLGALDDMTVTQVAAVSEMHNARPDYKFAELWKSAVRIGRDHVASVVNTLALAYVGTSLAVMVLFVISEQQLQWIANSESIAVEIVGAMVGSVGLIVAVPLATSIAAYAVHKSGELEQEGNAEPHSHEH